MDSLALLCNLYGEGPVTLRRLREAGCRTCDDIVRTDAAELARALRMPRAATERFQREARELALRAVVIEEPASAVASVVPLPPREPVRGAGIELRPDLIDGLDASACLRLRAHGVVTIEDLARSDALELSTALEMPVTRASRLQFLARRHAEPSTAEPSAAEPPLRDAILMPRRSELSAARFSPAEDAPEPDEARIETSELANWVRQRALTSPLAPAAQVPSATKAPVGPSEPVRAPDLAAPPPVEEGASGPFA